MTLKLMKKRRNWKSLSPAESGEGGVFHENPKDSGSYPREGKKQEAEGK